MADDIDVDAITKLLNDPTVPVELRNEIVNDWVLADPTAKDTWGPLVESNKLTLTDDSKRALFVANGPFGGPDGLQGVILKQQQAIAREALTKDVATGTTVAGASQRSKDLASSSSGASTSDELLDQASEGLRYFEVFLPLYSRVKNPGAMSRDAACARYDESREMSFAAMRSDATLVTTAAGDLEPEQRSIGDQAQHLAPVWTGKAGKAATTYLGTFGTEAAQVRTWLTSAASALSQGADQLEASVRAKAVAVSGLYTGQVGGKTPDQIDTIITVKQGNPFSSDNDDTIKAMSQWFPGIKLDERCMNDDLTEETRYSAIQSCQQFVESSFEPAVENTWKDFIQTCDTCDTSVKQIYTVITDTLGAVNPAVFAPLDTGVPATPPEGKHGGTDGRSTSPDPGPRTTGRDGGTPSVSGSVPTAGGGGVAPTGGAGPAPTPGSPTPGDVSTAAPVTSQGAGGGATTETPQVPGPTPTAVPGPTPTAVPAGLPTGAGWVSDPTSLPKGWTIDPTTGQLLPPDSPGSKGDPEVHSAAAGELLDGDGKGDLGGARPGVGGHGPAAGPGADGTAPAAAPAHHVVPDSLAVDPATGQPAGVAGGASGVTGGAGPADGVTGSTLTVTDQGVSMQISAEDAGGGGAHIDVTDSTGQVTGYRVEIGADGAPHLVPDTAVAPVDGASTPAAASGTASAPGAAPPSSATTVGAGAASSFDGGAATVDTASASAPAAASTGSTSSTAPTPAPVHSAAVGGSWADPPGGAAGGGSGAQLASVHSGAGAGSPGTSGAQLAGAGHDGPAGTSGSDGSGTTGMGGTGAGGGSGSESQEHRVSQQWRVLDDTFVDDSATWATLSDVLGPRDRQAAGDQENR